MMAMARMMTVAESGCSDDGECERIGDGRVSESKINVQSMLELKRGSSKLDLGLPRWC